MEDVCLNLCLTDAVDKSEVLSDCDLDFLGTNRYRRWGVVGGLELMPARVAIFGGISMSVLRRV